MKKDTTEGVKRRKEIGNIRKCIVFSIIIMVFAVFATVMIISGNCKRVFDLFRGDWVKPAMAGVSKNDDKEEDYEYTGKNEVDYSVISGTKTTVDENTPGQAVVFNRKQFNSYRGYLLTLKLPEGFDSALLDYQDDYMKRKLTISYPIEYYDSFSRCEVEGLMTEVARIRHKNSVNVGKLIIRFNKTFAFHYYVEDGILYIKYGSPSYYYDHIIAIDPGHGGQDYGAYTDGKEYVEKEIVSDIMDNLIRDYEGQSEVMVYFSRAGDTGVSLSDRIQMANDVGAELFVSLHCNFLPWYYGTAYGVEVAYNQNDKSKDFNSKWLAEKMQSEFSEAMGLYNRGVLADGDLKVLRLAKMPACLIEMGFISNAGDAEILADSAKQEMAAKTIEEVLADAMEEMENK